MRLAAHLLERCKLHDVDAALASHLMPSQTSLPLGPVMDDTIAALIKHSSQYGDPNVQAWSELVSSSPALIILTPQYNWSFPGPLKNVLDHLYNEWQKKPILLITYGGHGGSKCSESLKLVLEGGFKAMLICEPVNITLPSDYIRGSQRVNPSQADQQEFRGEYEQLLDAAILSLKERL